MQGDLVTTFRNELRCRAAYDRRIVPLEDGTWYWHLYLDGERLNGGLSPSRAEARMAAGHAISFDMHGHYACYAPPSRLRTSLL